VTHLGDRACLLVDGELAVDEHDDAMAHLAGCGQCRRQVTAYRHLKAWLAQTPAEPGPALMARLLPIPDRQPMLCEAITAFASGSSPSRSRARSVAAAGFAASVVVGLGAAATGSSSVAAGGGSASLSGSSTVTSVPIGVNVSRPGNPAAVSVVYRRP
jgi:anti-sigma factor RsiW